MKIYRLNEFLKLPEGTVFCRGKEWVFGSPSIKGESLDNGTGDFWARSLDWIDANSSGEAFDRLDEMLEKGASYPLVTCESRDGMLDKEALFLVYEKADLESLIKDLQKALTL